MIICSYQGGNAKPPKESARGNISERMLEFVPLKCPFYEVKFVLFQTIQLGDHL